MQSDKKDLFKRRKRLENYKCSEFETQKVWYLKKSARIEIFLVCGA